jgi:hypothetical protein
MRVPADQPNAPAPNNGLDPNGHPFPQDLRLDMQRQLGGDFSHVRVHPNSFEHRALENRAFTEGNHIHFAPGTYAPYTPGGRDVIAHELAHVVQQGGGVRP